MALNELIETFEFLRTRISEHGDYLKEDETRTRQVLIDPLLKVLGWDVTDPEHVELEYRIETNYQVGRLRADYVLMAEPEPDAHPKPVAVVEAKKLRSDLLDMATNQVLNYATSKGIPWMLVTDGESWAMYKVFMQVELAQKLWVKFNVSSESSSSCALKSLALWRSNLNSEGDPIRAQEPVVAPFRGHPPTVPDDDDGDIIQVSQDWIPLREVSCAGKGHRLSGSLACPDGEIKPVRGWAGLYAEVADYLARAGHFARCNLPFGFTKGARYAVAREPIHGDGEPFVSPMFLTGGYHLETNNSAFRSLDFTFRLIEKCKGGPNRLDANDFKFQRS